jgi:hypothetical protein
MSVYFISENFLKATTAISANVDVNSIAPFIPTAQDMYIQDSLGSNFYKYLWAAYSAQTLTADEVTLVEKIKPALAWRAAEMTLPSLTYQVKNKGPQVQFGDNSGQITLEELNYLRNEFKNKAEFYEERLKKFLCLSGTAYPQYQNNNSTDISPNTATAYECDLAFPSRRCNRCNSLYYTSYCGCGIH